MIRTLLAAVAVASLGLGAAAVAQTPAATAPAAKFSVKSTIGQLLDNPEAKAAFAKAFPDVATNPQLEMAREMVLADLASQYADYFPADKMKQLDADLAKIK
jgi:para-nitrobenzyl esterase